jgi:hypothetical protein
MIRVPRPRLFRALIPRVICSMTINICMFERSYMFTSGNIQLFAEWKYMFYKDNICAHRLNI